MAPNAHFTSQSRSFSPATLDFGFMSAAFGLGLTLQFNLFTNTFGLPILRFSDGVLLPAGLMLLLALTPREALRVSGLTAALGLMIGASILLKFAPGQGDTYFSLTLLAAIFCALVFVTLENRADRFAVWLAWGSLVGFGLSALVLVAHAGGQDLTSLGMAVPRSAQSLQSQLLSLVKPGGLWIHGNEGGHVFAMAGAPALYLSLRYRRPGLYAAYFLVFLLTFTITLNRGSVIAPTIGLVVAFLAAGRGGALFRLLFGMVAVVGLVGALSLLPAISEVRNSVIDRFTQDSNAQNNLSERIETLIAGVRVAFAHPFGIGVVERYKELDYLARIPTPHNAIISLAYQIGLVFALGYIASVIRLGRHGSKTTLVSLIAAYALPSMMFEELTLNPVFQFSIAVTLGGAIISVASRQQGVPGTRRIAPAGPAFRPIAARTDRARD